jgi:hypothetical protein
MVSVVVRRVEKLKEGLPIQFTFFVSARLGNLSLHDAAVNGAADLGLLLITTVGKQTQCSGPLVRAFGPALMWTRTP